MNPGTMRPDADQDNLVIHHLRLGQVTKANIEGALNEIRATFPLDRACFDDKEQVLNLAYNASRINVQGIDTLLHKHHLKIIHDWWTHSREGYDCLLAQLKPENRRQ